MKKQEKAVADGDKDVNERQLDALKGPNHHRNNNNNHNQRTAPSYNNMNVNSRNPIPFHLAASSSVHPSFVHHPSLQPNFGSNQYRNNYSQRPTPTSSYYNNNMSSNNMYVNPQPPLSSYLGPPLETPSQPYFGFHNFKNHVFPKYYYPSPQKQVPSYLPLESVSQFALEPRPPQSLSYSLPSQPSQSRAHQPSLHNEKSLSDQISEQIEYYFSDINLEDDWYLKKQMDSEGWVDINLIAGFNMVKMRTTDIDVVKEAVKYSQILEFHNDKVRRRRWRRVAE